MCECFCAVKRECDELQRVSNKSMKELILFFENKNSFLKPEPKFGCGAQFLFDEVYFLEIRNTLEGAVGRIIHYEYVISTSIPRPIYVYTLLFDNRETLRFTEDELSEEREVQIIECK